MLNGSFTHTRCESCATLHSAIKGAFRIRCLVAWVSGPIVPRVVFALKFVGWHEVHSPCPGRQSSHEFRHQGCTFGHHGFRDQRQFGHDERPFLAVGFDFLVEHDLCCSRQDRRQWHRTETHHRWMLFWVGGLRMVIPTVIAAEILQTKPSGSTFCQCAFARAWRPTNKTTCSRLMQNPVSCRLPMVDEHRVGRCISRALNRFGQEQFIHRFATTNQLPHAILKQDLGGS